MRIDHIHFYVEDAPRYRDWFVRCMGFQPVAGGRTNPHTHTEVVRSGQVEFVLSSPLCSTSPVAQFLSLHPPGVANLAFGVWDLDRVMEEVVAKGAKVREAIQFLEFPQGCLKWSKIAGEAGIDHTLIERRGVTPLLPTLDNWVEQMAVAENPEISFAGIDHVVLNVASGDLQQTVSWYEDVLGFQRQQSFSIQTQQSALSSQVMVHPVSGVQLPVNEPASDNSQIQEFLDANQGAGIQHIALSAPQIAQITQKLRNAGLSFLEVPDTYYTQLQQRHPELQLSQAEWEEIIQAQILVDCQEASSQLTHYPPLLLQIFTQPIFSQPTFFFELIERRSQAKGFGEGNFRALFEAMEREQLKRASL